MSGERKKNKHKKERQGIMHVNKYVKSRNKMENGCKGKNYPSLSFAKIVGKNIVNEWRKEKEQT